jgi:hypothetical protein
LSEFCEIVFQGISHQYLVYISLPPSMQHVQPVIISMV